MPPPILIVSGPPGAGKTTLARHLAETGPSPAVHLRMDSFFEAIVSGYIQPWLPASRDQNHLVTRVIVAAAGTYALGGYHVIIDGVVGPWFLDLYRDEARRLGCALDYLVLRPDRATVVARARDRDTGPLVDYPPRIYEGFADCGPLEPHVIDNTALDLAALTALARAGVAEGRYRLET